MKIVKSKKIKKEKTKVDGSATKEKFKKRPARKPFLVRSSTLMLITNRKKMNRNLVRKMESSTRKLIILFVTRIETLILNRHLTAKFLMRSQVIVRVETESLLVVLI